MCRIRPIILPIRPRYMASSPNVMSATERGVPSMENTNSSTTGVGAGGGGSVA